MSPSVTASPLRILDTLAILIFGCSWGTHDDLTITTVVIVGVIPGSARVTWYQDAKVRKFIQFGEE